MAFLCLVGAVSSWLDEDGGTVAWMIAVLVLGYGSYHFASPATKQAEAAEEAERAQRRAAARIPHVIREADGCKVYAFDDGGRTHYFTRCGNESVTTESSWTEKSGKSTVTKTEIIKTEVAGNE